MKKIFQYIFGMVALLAATSLVSCSPEDINEVNSGALPTLNADNIVITVNDSTNQVTFKYNGTGVMPIWKFSDGSTPSISTKNGLEKIYTTAGEYSVEVRLMNANGIADGSVVKTFTIANSIIDYTAYFTRLCGSEGTKTWMIAADEVGHIGCGESGSDGTGWYSAAANEKSASGMYENRFVFSTVDGNTEGGAYTYDPGTSGTIFVNIGCTVFTAPSGATEDYSVASEKQETTFAFSVSGSDLYITFPAQTLVGYVANDDMYSNPTFRVLSLRENKMELVYDNGSIAWHFTYCPETAELTKEEMLTQSTWYFDKNTAGHVACGETGSDGTGWWSAAPNEKADFGLYDMAFKFDTDGTYTLTTGDLGIYVNIGCTVFTAPEGETSDYNVAIAGNTVTSTWSLVEEGSDTYLVLPANTPLGYVPNDDIYASPRFKVIELTESSLVLVCDNGTIAWQYRLVTSTDGGDTDVFDEGEELLGSEYAQGIIGSWTWESSTYGHFGCGPSVDDASSWWSAPVDDKAEKGLYDDVLTFNSDGSYVFNPGDGGTVYVNIGLTISPFVDQKGEATEDYQVTVSEQTSTYTLSESGGSYYITFPANTIVSYVPSDDFYAAPQVKIVKVCENVIEFNTVQSGISWHYRLKRVQ